MADANVIRVLIADDHALFRKAIQSVLNDEDDIDVIGEAGDGDEAVAMAVEHAPDVVLLDVNMPKRSGIDAARAIKEQLPSAQVVMFTVSDEESDLFEAIKAGASGYLLKEVDPGEVAA